VQNKIGERIRESRKKMVPPLSQDGLAARAGVVGKTIWRYETGASTPPRDEVRRLAEVLGVDPVWLEVGDREEPADTAVVADLDDDVQTAARALGLSDDEARRLDSVRQSIGRPTLARLMSYAADIIDGRPLSTAQPEPDRPTTGRKLRR
jgi:transcriptional regulator with XRE-family HTH domain